MFVDDEITCSFWCSILQKTTIFLQKDNNNKIKNSNKNHEFIITTTKNYLKASVTYYTFFNNKPIHPFIIVSKKSKPLLGDQVKMDQNVLIIFKWNFEKQQIISLINDPSDQIGFPKPKYDSSSADCPHFSATQRRLWKWAPRLHFSAKPRMTPTKASRHRFSSTYNIYIIWCKMGLHFWN
jgi:hypothetical protein